VRHWAGDSTDSGATALQKHREELRGYKLSEEEIDAMIGAEADEQEINDDVFLVWAENWASWEVFSALSSRWQQDGMSGRFYGLPRADIESTLRLMQVDPTQYRQVFDDLQAMENEALRILNRGR
jgi:hypothetical protein